MITRLRVRNFKKLEMDVELGRTVIFIGPNNSGKTTALQALILWNVGLRQWLAKRGDAARPEKRPGVAINRKDLISIPTPNANLLWKNLHVRKVTSQNGKTQKTQNIRIDIIVDGITDGQPWSCGFEFDYQNEESFNCRPIRKAGFEEKQVKESDFTSIPIAASGARIAYLPPMSGLAAVEPKWEPGRINVLLGEGQTAQVLRNLCYQIYEQDNAAWEALVGTIRHLFGASIFPPTHLAERGEITMEYEENGVRLDLSASGRGLQQTLLLLAHLYANPKTILLLDEPDAHLEIIRQRQICQLLMDIANAQGSQIIAASHSEVVLNESAERGQVIAFLGKPHPLLGGRKSQFVKALTELGFEQYYQAEQLGWVIYIEGTTDLSLLLAFARQLDHPAQTFLEAPFVHYINSNIPGRAREHFYGLREGKPDLVGVAIFDRLNHELLSGPPLYEAVWSRREFENYLCIEEALLAYAAHGQPDDLFALAEKDKRVAVMQDSIREIENALLTLGKPGPWSGDIKASDEFLGPVFNRFSEKMQIPLEIRKSQLHRLVPFIPKDRIDPEIIEKLDLIVKVVNQANPDKS